jgi:hypothetical protein
MVFLLKCGLTVSLSASRQKSFESVGGVRRHSTGSVGDLSFYQ